MTAPSLQDVLNIVPAAMIDSHNELIPGVQASKQNLNTLLEYIKKEDIMTYTSRDEPGVTIRSWQQKSIKFYVFGPFQACKDTSHRPHLSYKEVKHNEDGLLEGLCWAKSKLKRLRDEGTCSDCESGPNEYPRKRLKAVGMPKCEECIIKAVLQ